MQSFDESSCVFIVRLWSEPREITGKPRQLRGTVEHVPSRARCSITGLDGILEFMRPYLHEMKVPLTATPRLNRWRERLKGIAACLRAQWR